MKVRLIKWSLPTLSALLLPIAPALAQDVVTVGNVTYSCTTQCRVSTSEGFTRVTDCCGGTVRILTPGGGGGGSRVQ